MSIALIVTRGYGNGTLSGDVNFVVTRGYTAGEAVVVVPTPTPPTQPGAGGGGGSSPHWWPSQHAPIGSIDYEKREEIASDLMVLYEGVYDVAKVQPDGELADAAAELVTNYAPTGAADLPSPREVAWQEFIDEGRAKVLQTTLRLKELQARAALLDARVVQENVDEEDAAILLLLS